MRENNEKNLLKSQAPRLLSGIQHHNVLLRSKKESEIGKQAEHLDLKQLDDVKIRPMSELSGKGLRSTFVDLGTEWTTTAFLKTWEANTQRSSSNRRSQVRCAWFQKLWKPIACAAMATTSACLIYGMVEIHKKYRPKITLPALKNEVAYEQIKSYTNMVLTDYILTGEVGLKEHWLCDSDPEDIYEGCCLLERFSNLGAVKVKSIHYDPKNKKRFLAFCTGIDKDPVLCVLCAKAGPSYKLVRID